MLRKGSNKLPLADLYILECEAKYKGYECKGILCQIIVRHNEDIRSPVMILTCERCKGTTLLEIKGDQIFINYTKECAYDRSNINFNPASLDTGTTKSYIIG